MDDDELDDGVAAGLELGVAAGDGVVAGTPPCFVTVPFLGRSTWPLKVGQSDGDVRMNAAAATPRVTAPRALLFGGATSHLETASGMRHTSAAKHTASATSARSRHDASPPTVTRGTASSTRAANGEKRARPAGLGASSQPRADQRPGVTHGAIDAILGMIGAGALSAGDKLPREKELAAQLGLSRNSLREAVRALTLLRVLEPRQGDGTYVTSLQPQLLTEAIGLVADLMNERAVAELYQVRRILEAEASMLAAVRMTPEELEHLRRVLERITANSPVDDFIDADADFHDIVARASGNQVLASLLRSLSSRTMRARRWRALLEEGALERTVDQHRRIFRAIEQRDPEVARAAAALHVAEGETWLRDQLPRIESGLQGADQPEL